MQPATRLGMTGGSSHAPGTAAQQQARPCYAGAAHAHALGSFRVAGVTGAGGIGRLGRQHLQHAQQQQPLRRLRLAAAAPLQALHALPCPQRQQHQQQHQQQHCHHQQQCQQQCQQRRQQQQQLQQSCQPGLLPPGIGAAPSSHTVGARGSRATCHAAASSSGALGGSGSSSSGSSSQRGPQALSAASLAAGLADTAADLRDLVGRFRSLWRSFLPMLSLFFCLSFINTILDSLKDTLVITAAGGGAFVIPYLTVYAVLPLSMVFLVAFSAASLRMSRAALFNAIVVVFMAFFGGFALFLYPNADVLHPHALADQLQQVLPQGLAGLVGMMRNWTFTLFFCMSELWGDVCMGLLFWGLANEITNLSDAATLYPLFGLGANLAQALAGIVLKATTTGSSAEFGTALQLSMAAVIGIAGVSIMLQQHITNEAAAAAAAKRHRLHLHRHNSSSSAAGSRCETPAAAAGAAVTPAQLQPSEQPQPQEQQQPQQQPQQQQQRASKKGPSMMATFRVLAASVEIRCLAIMSLAQGLCNSLMEFAWKCHMRLLYPSPADFTAFLGDVATWSGIVTGGLMLLSPLLFERLGWRGVANATPTILMYGGSAFFVACIAYQHLFGAAAAAAGAGATGPGGLALLRGLVMFGALLYVFGKGAKFSLFKPAEEMVYITLDEDGRTRGKAAIDVVGAQTGKSGGSLLQQALLLFSAGSITGIMPVLFAVFFVMLRGWSSAVLRLSAVRHYSYDSPLTSMDEDGEEEEEGGPKEAAGVSGSNGSSTLSAAAQQELAEKLGSLANGAGAAGAGSSGAASSTASSSGGQQQRPGSSSYQAAMARSSSSGAGSGDSSSNAGDSSSGSSSNAGGDSSSDVSGLAGAAENGSLVTLDADAARAFRRNARTAQQEQPVPDASQPQAGHGSSSSSSGALKDGSSG